MEPINVEVFPVAPDRWIAAFEDFSTEARRPEDVEGEVRVALGEVKGSSDIPVVLVADDDGSPCNLYMARARADRLACS